MYTSCSWSVWNEDVEEDVHTLINIRTFSSSVLAAALALAVWNEDVEEEVMSAGEGPWACFLLFLTLGKQICQKRPIMVSKETYYSVKRDQCQKRPIIVSKET